MPKVTRHVELLRCTPNPQEIVAMGARLCYSKSRIGDIARGVAKKDQAEFIEMLNEMGHTSLSEHASFTFGIEGVSRSLLAQITRHRIASFSVQSQRYVKLSEDFDFVLPPAIESLGEEAVREYEHQMKQIGAWYASWREKLGDVKTAGEDARFVLPNAAATRIIMTMNARELNHFFALRCCNRAQWEIRALAWDMLRLVQAEAPALFSEAGPVCLRGRCDQGKMSCGKAAEVRAFAASQEREAQT